MKLNHTKLMVIVISMACGSLLGFVPRGRSNRLRNMASAQHAPSRRQNGACSRSHYVTQNPGIVLAYSRYDSLVAGIAEISLGTSLAVLWSESSVIMTGCGPLRLNDGLERASYQAVIVVAGACLFTRIAFGSSVPKLIEEYFSSPLPLEDITLIQVKAAEYLALFTVIGAILTLSVQVGNGTAMNGMSGIDVEACRAQQAFRILYND